MSRVMEYRKQLRQLQGEWDAYLRQESGLPGPRGNLELAQAVAEEGTADLFARYIEYSAERAPTGTVDEYLAFCGTLGHGYLLGEGDQAALSVLRAAASDRRWRLREAVAMALQHLGDVDMDRLLAIAAEWSQGNRYEQRAAAAALCEPRLLSNPDTVRGVLDILTQITAQVQEAQDRKSEAFIALRKGLGYCWSVAVAALPEEGKTAMERWFTNSDPDVRWIMRENLKKTRLIRVDSAWVDKWSAQINKKS